MTLAKKKQILKPLSLSKGQDDDVTSSNFQCRHPDPSTGSGVSGSIEIDLEVKSKKWENKKTIKTFIKKTCEKIIPLTELKKILKKDFTLELAISLVSDAQMKKINFEFRGKNKATNVLSFPALDENLIRKVGIKKAATSTNYLFLGDIIISFETLQKESLAQKKKFEDHISHLLLHSILHLIGHDHEDEKMAEIMENLEIKILQKLKIKNPYN